jgi:hypothetical protein
MARFERQVDPDRALAPEERARRAEAAVKAHFTKLAYRSARVRRKSASPDSASLADGDKPS